MEYLNLPMHGKRNLAINDKYFEEIKEELERFLDDFDEINNRRFVKKILFNQEIKSNNTIEGINDDVLFIEKVIREASQIEEIERRRRIINLYRGYKYILTHRIIDERHLHELYTILSEGLISVTDLSNMGCLYREAPVYILKNGRLDTVLDQGLPYDLIPKYIKYYFDFVDERVTGTATDAFIKSQIMHFYFVYIHPYFDVNGRTSRTLAMWYLLNNQAYPYIIFNRAITNGEKNYDQSIIDTKKYADISFFIKYMMVNLKKKKKKELIMNQINHSVTSKMDTGDFQTLNYILSMNGEINVLTFASIYRRNNTFKSVIEIYEECIQPLLDKGILEVVRLTGKNMFLDFPNEVLRINPKNYDKDNAKIRRLNLSNK